MLTPSIKEGCIDGIMRGVIIGFSSKLDLTVKEGKLKTEDFMQADEVFVCNSQFGIQWIGQFQKKSYTNTISKQLYLELGKTPF